MKIFMFFHDTRKLRRGQEIHLSKISSTFLSPRAKYLCTRNYMLRAMLNLFGFKV